MTDFRFQHLERLKVGGTDEKMDLSVLVPTSSTGRTYRECPEKSCSPRLFQMGGAPEVRTLTDAQTLLVRREIGKDGTTCPYCGHEDSDRAFLAEIDIEAAKEQVAFAAKQDVHDWLTQMARDFNNQCGGGFLSVSMEVTTPPPSTPAVIREDLLRGLTCGTCRRAYGVYAIALYCPDCGAAALKDHFWREMDLVNRQLELAGSKEQDDPELSYRLLGNAHEDVLTAFETAQKTVYKHLVATRMSERISELASLKAIGNAFQNVDRARALFAHLSIDPYASLAEDDLETLKLNIQKRHVIGHNLSIADDRYQALANDVRPGQTIAILRADVEEFATATSDVIANLDAELRPKAGLQNT
jgi:hypothetical protein